MKLKKTILSLFLLILAAATFAEEWYVCLSSYSKPENAQEFCSQAAKYNLPSWIYQAKTAKGDYYRVLYSYPCATADQARLLRDSIASSKQAAKLNLTGLWVCVAQKENEYIPPVAVVEEPEVFESVAEIPEETIEEEIAEEPIEEEPIEEEPIEETPEPLEELEEMEINDLEELNIQENVAFGEPEKLELSDILSPAVQKIIMEYPVNTNFELDRVSIYDIENIHSTNYESEDLDNLLSPFANESENIIAMSAATYKNSENEKSFEYLIAEGQNNCFDNIQRIVEESELTTYVPVAIKDQIYNGWYSVDENEAIRLYAMSEDKNSIVCIKSSDFTNKDFEAFLEDFSYDSSILYYPQIKDNLFELPSKVNKPGKIFISCVQISQTWDVLFLDEPDAK